MADALERLRAELAARYTIERELGRGGMATVYLALDVVHDRRVALKVLHPEFAMSLMADRFAREIGIAAVLEHPHIVSLYDSGAIGGLPYYVMQYVDGESLRSRLDREGALPLAEALRITREVAEALTCAHEHGIVHRDIKPDNVMLLRDHVLVTDFGIARAIDVAGGGRVTSEGLILGTPSYMSPEQVAAEAVIDGRADIYALGCVMYEMLTGHPPFLGNTAREIMVRHSVDPVPPISSARPSVPTDVQRAVGRALEKVAADRYATVAEFSLALDQAAAAAHLLNDATIAGDRRARLRWAAVGAAVVIAGALGIMALRNFNTHREPLDPHVVAVMPFRIVGDSGNAYLREGMMDLLSTAMGAIEGVQPVDSRTVLTTLRRQQRAGEDADPAGAAASAELLKSGRFVLGDVISTPSGLSLTARLLDTHGGGRVEAEVHGSRDSLFALVDRLAVQLLARNAGEGRRLADLTSESMPAVREYLAGRAAWRRGEADRAIQHFTQALETDSTFALAALGMAASGAWSQQAGQSQALRRGLRTGYALRSRLSRRDQLLFEAYVLPSDPAEHTALRQLVGWQRAAEAAPQSAEAQYEYGDRLFHSGVQLGVPDAEVAAAARFSSAVALDSAYAPPLAHLVEVAARARDRAATERLLHVYTTLAAEADANDYVRWRAAIALSDDATLAKLRGSREKFSQASLNRVIGFGLTDGVGLDDVDSSALELHRRIVARTATGQAVHPGQGLHSWAMNRGRRATATDAIAAIRSVEPLAPGYSIVYFDADQLPVLDALFWDGDSAVVTVAERRLEARVSGAVPHESGARVVLLWQQTNSKGGAAGPLRDRLRTGAAPGDSAAVHGGSPALCVAMLDALSEVPSADRRPGPALKQLDSLLSVEPFQFGVDFANLVLARAYERNGDVPAALRAVRRRPYDWDTGPLYLTTYLREEGRLAALSGDRAGAARAYHRFLDLRNGADPAMQGMSVAVQVALDALEQSPSKPARSAAP
jgi:serine/threonine-protein kinase